MTTKRETILAAIRTKLTDTPCIVGDIPPAVA